MQFVFGGDEFLVGETATAAGDDGQDGSVSGTRTRHRGGEGDKRVM